MKYWIHKRHKDQVKIFQHEEDNKNEDQSLKEELEVSEDKSRIEKIDETIENIKVQDESEIVFAPSSTNTSTPRKKSTISDLQPRRSSRVRKPPERFKS